MASGSSSSMSSLRSCGKRLATKRQFNERCEIGEDNSERKSEVNTERKTNDKHEICGVPLNSQLTGRKSFVTLHERRHSDVQVLPIRTVCLSSSYTNTRR